MATITITCPDCETSVKVSAEVEGKKVRCKSCGEVYVAEPEAPAKSAKSAKPAAKPAAKAAVKPAPKPAAKPAPQPAKEPEKPKPPAGDEDEDDGKAYGVTVEDLTPRCPHCANEMASATAKICLHCGYNTETRLQATTRKTEDQTGADIFLWLLPGILCAIFVIGWSIFDICYCAYADEWFTEDKWWQDLLRSGFTKTWGTVFSAAFVLAAARFAIKRLIFDNKPPEVEIKDKQKEGDDD